MRRPRLVRSLGWAVVTVGLTGLPTAAAADPVDVGPDRGAAQDVLVVQPRLTTTPEVWLSSSDTLHYSRSSHSMLRVGTIDVDATTASEAPAPDPRPIKRGHLRHVRSHRTEPDLLSSGDPSVASQSGNTADDSIPGSDSTVAADDAGHAEIGVPDVRCTPAPRGAPSVEDCSLGSSGSRAPPLSR